MGTTNIVKFANDPGANVQSDATYPSTTAKTGFVPGPADPAQANKALRQSSAVAAAVAALATDPSMGNQGSFNDTEDAAVLATKIRDAIYQLPDLKLSKLYTTLLQYLLSDPALNSLASSFTPSALLNLTDTQLRALAADGLFKSLLTPRGILTNPPVSDWAYLASITDAAAYTDLAGYVGQREYRVLANGMVEVRISFFEGFRPRADSSIFFNVGWIPLAHAPVNRVVAPIVGTRRDSNNAPRDLVTADAYVTIEPGGSPTYLLYRYTTLPRQVNFVPVVVRLGTKLISQTTAEGWSLRYADNDLDPYNKYSFGSVPSDANATRATVVSLVYMPRLPYPYAYAPPNSLMTPLAPDTLASGLTTAPLAWAVVVLLLAIGYLYRELQRQRDKYEALSTSARDQLIALTKDSEREKRELMQQLLAISERVNRGVDVFDRFRPGSRSVITSRYAQEPHEETAHEGPQKGYADEEPH